MESQLIYIYIFLIYIYILRIMELSGGRWRWCVCEYVNVERGQGGGIPNLLHNYEANCNDDNI